MLHFLSPPAESPENITPPLRHPTAQSLRRHVSQWPFRVTPEAAVAALAEGLSNQRRAPACDHGFVS